MSPVLQDAPARLLDHGILTRGQELRLLRRATLSRDCREKKRATDQIASSNMRLVASIAAKYSPPQSLTGEDLFAAGCQGLYRAIQKFDVDRGFRFSTYATRWIRQSISRAIEDSGSTIRVPSHMHQKVARASRARTDLSATLGEPPDSAVLADYLGVRSDEVEFYRTVTARCGPHVTLDEPLSEDGTKLSESLSDPKAYTEGSLPHLFNQKAADLEALPAALDHLKPEYRHIIVSRYGLGDSEPRTLRTLANELGLSQERVRQKQIRATEALLQYMIAARSGRGVLPNT